VEDQRRLQVIPQLVIYYKKTDSIDADVDHADDHVGDDETNFADSSFDTMVSIASTLPDRHAVEIIPDFFIV
jgi:hypothetical protein